MIWYLTELYLSKRSKLPVYGFICRACSCQVSAFRQVTTSWKCLSWAAPQSGKMPCLEVCERNRFVRVFVDGRTWKFHVLFDALTGNPSTLLDFPWTLPVHPCVWQVSLTSESGPLCSLSGLTVNRKISQNLNAARQGVKIFDIDIHATALKFDVSENYCCGNISNFRMIALTINGNT